MPIPASAAAAIAVVLVSQMAAVSHACGGAGCSGEQAEICQSPAAEPSSQDAPAMRIGIDPQTGEYSASPAAPSQATSAMKTAPLAPAQQAMGAAGGFKLDTRGVRHAFVAEANPGGLPHTHCIDSRSPQN